MVSYSQLFPFLYGLWGLIPTHRPLWGQRSLIWVRMGYRSVAYRYRIMDPIYGLRILFMELRVVPEHSFLKTKQKTQKLIFTLTPRGPIVNPK